MASLAPFKTFIAPAAKIVARLRGSLTYNNAPCTAQTRPYLGHIPYFAPKFSSDIEHREQQSKMQQTPRRSRRYCFGAK